MRSPYLKIKKGLLETAAPKTGFDPLYPAGVLAQEAVEPLKLGIWRYYQRYYFLKRSQWWSPDKLKDYQLGKMKRLLAYAYKNVPYYEDLFRKNRLSPEDFVRLDDVKKLPLLSKQVLAKDPERLIDKNLSARKRKKILELRYTSGSTGRGKILYRDKRTAYQRKAAERFRLDLYGLRPSSRGVWLWARPFVNRNSKDARLIDPYSCRLHISALPKTEQELKESLAAIADFRPQYITGACSFMYKLAGIAENSGFRIKIPVFINCFENIYDFQKQRIRQQFGCEIFDHYSSEEEPDLGIMFPECGNMHVESRNGIIEIVGDRGEAIAPGRAGRVLWTKFDNYVMPLIRYEMDDLASLSDKGCGCKRCLPVLKSLDGRCSQTITVNNKQIYPASLSVILGKSVKIKECQFVQDESKDIIINIVRDKGYSEEDTRQLLDNFKQYVDRDIKPRVNFLNALPRTEAGKLLMIVNRQESRDEK